MFYCFSLIFLDFFYPWAEIFLGKDPGAAPLYLSRSLPTAKHSLDNSVFATPPGMNRPMIRMKTYCREREVEGLVGVCKQNYDLDDRGA